MTTHAAWQMTHEDACGAQAEPVKYIDEALVLNLCSMYDLAWASGSDNKRVLSSWISKVAPDDFDLNCTRL
jgi:hypothetical protein